MNLSESQQAIMRSELDRISRKAVKRQQWINRLLDCTIIAFVTTIAVCASIAYGAESGQIQQSKIEKFLSHTGDLVTIEEFKLESSTIKSNSKEIQHSIQVISGQGEPAFFYRLSHKNDYSTDSASISRKDLFEIQKAIISLTQHAAVESSKANYIERKFVTNDGFTIGYYRSDSPWSKDGIGWFLKLEKFAKSTFWFDDPSTIQAAVDHALAKISKIKKEKKNNANN